jgi:predicted MPP superfamily phosphohydrolase
MSMSLFAGSSLALALAVVVAAAALRGRLYATFAAVLLGIHTSVTIALYPHAGVLGPLFVYLQATVYLHFASLIFPRMRPFVWRALVSVPASFFVAGTFLAAPWAIAAAFGLSPLGAWVPYALALAGLVQSLFHRAERIDIALDGAEVPSLRRHPRGDHRVARPLRVVQISDPHLGPFMSERRLRRLVERAVAQAPDLVLLTGDFVTMESHGAGDALARSLSPLRDLPGRAFACLGNHDHEAPETVARALADAGVALLVDDAALVETPAGPVQIVGLDFSFRNRRAKMAAACAKSPRIAGALRLVLLHDPGAFAELDEGEADLVFSGHTHGGQLGLLSLGLPHTIVSALTRIPDHGFWARGRDRLYVHRGTGHYGFPLRLGVPSEESVLHVHVASDG